MRRGMLSRDRIAVAATASGGETMAPNTKAAAQGISGTSNFSAAPTASVVAIDQADGEQADRADVGLEVAPRGQQRRLVEDRRQHQHQDQLRIEGELRQLRDEAERQAADDQGDRIGKLEVAGDPAEGHGAEQQQENEFEQQHGLTCRVIDEHTRLLHLTLALEARKIRTDCA